MKLVVSGSVDGDTELPQFKYLDACEARDGLGFQDWDCSFRRRDGRTSDPLLSLGYEAV